MSISTVQRKIVVILGPTASGKSALAVRLAKEYGGEVISADSRQVYRGLDRGTCKITRREMRGIPHHLLDVASPRRQFSAARYDALARRALRGIIRRGKLPIICGGSGQYIDALLGAHPIPNVPPDAKLRARFERLSVAELFAKLKNLDPRRAAEIDRHNPRRLVRALEIVITTGKPVPNVALRQVQDKKSPYDFLKFGLNPPAAELRRRLNTRLAKDIRCGLITETKKLHEQGLSWKRLNELGLEYRLVAQYLRGEIQTKEELSQKLQRELWQYTKRQMRWWKRDKDIRWARDERTAMLIARSALRRK
ncbi:MAG: hypothetical protein RL681_377 [Candidatus Parcubacteria bacterium]|jgi:tRNA dimethylallyltransferase